MCRFVNTPSLISSPLVRNIEPPPPTNSLRPTRSPAGHRGSSRLLPRHRRGSPVHLHLLAALIGLRLIHLGPNLFLGGLDLQALLPGIVNYLNPMHALSIVHRLNEAVPTQRLESSRVLLLRIVAFFKLILAPLVLPSISLTKGAAVMAGRPQMISGIGSVADLLLPIP